MNKMENEPTALVLDPNEGDVLNFVGISTRIKVRSEATNGAWTLIESTVEPYFPGFKLHTHHRMTETFYILEGTLAVQLGEQIVQANAGALIVVPPGVWHTYSNPSDVPAKYLLFMSPGGFEKYLEGLAEMIRTEPHWPPADKTKLNALAEKYDATPA
ncbi:MAG TPA: cupin domain-containing protein [Anaerolineae bacterium]|nr:cupin domain-containing protein [Anaerolineae bacterium]